MVIVIPYVVSSLSSPSAAFASFDITTLLHDLFIFYCDSANFVECDDIVIFGSLQCNWNLVVRFCLNYLSVSNKCFGWNDFDIFCKKSNPFIPAPLMSRNPPSVRWIQWIFKGLALESGLKWAIYNFHDRKLIHVITLLSKMH